MPVTIHDVAERLGLSVTTISRALAGYDDVAEATRQRVIEAAREMGYAPTHAARQLRRQRTETLGLVFPLSGGRFSDPFFSEFMAGVGDEASPRSYDLLVSVASPGEPEEQNYQRLVNSQRVDGFVLVRLRRADWRVRYLSDQGVPFTCFGRSRGAQEYVDVDGRSGMRALVQHLVGGGQRRIAFISAPAELSFVHERHLGYQLGLKEAGLSYDPALVIESDLTHSGGHRAAGELLRLNPRPDAIIGVNDLTALGAMRAAEEIGLKVGPDVAIGGFDGIEAGEHANPALTTVYQPVYEIGRQVCAMLLAIIEGEQPEAHERVIQPELIIRQSSLNGLGGGDQSDANRSGKE